MGENFTEKKFWEELKIFFRENCGKLFFLSCDKCFFHKNLMKTPKKRSKWMFGSVLFIYLF